MILFGSWKSEQFSSVLYSRVLRFWCLGFWLYIFVVYKNNPEFACYLIFGMTRDRIESAMRGERLKAISFLDNVEKIIYFDMFWRS